MEIRESFREPSGGRLYVCSTPIGNLQDASLRLIETLKSVDVVAAEDTRHTRKLLSYFDIHPPLMVSCHEHNEKTRVQDFVQWWAEGKAIALVSDAGTPGISDPGDDAIGAAIANGVPVIPVPGPSAVLTALIGSGRPIQPFTFLGFLPRDKSRSVETLRTFSGLPGTLVLYEAPHRLHKTLETIASVYPGCTLTLAKELTKRHETFLSGQVDEIVRYISDNPPRGEYVILIDLESTQKTGNDATAETATDDERLAQAIEWVRICMNEGKSHKEAVQIAVERTGARRKDVYQSTIKQ